LERYSHLAGPMKTKIEELRQKIREASGQDPVFGSSADCLPEIEETFLKRVLAFETSPKRTLFDLLRKSEVELPRPDEVTDEALTKRLWKVIRALVAKSVILGNTDHLSDRELYMLLWNETLRREFVISPHFTLHVDMTETGVDDGVPTYLKYYASKEERRMYSNAHPTFKMPAHVDPPRRRDHLIREEPSRSRRAKPKSALH